MTSLAGCESAEQMIARRRRLLGPANGMREAGVLIGIDGPAANVLKIRAPMPIQEAHADLLVAALAR